MQGSLAIVVSLVLGLPAHGQTNAFDTYTNPVLSKAPGSDGVKEIQALTPSMIADNDRVLPNTTAALIVVKTNDGRNSKLLVQAARQRIAGQIVPVLLLERFVTFKEGEERTIQVMGQNVDLFSGFHFNLDLGQVVPANLGGDLRFIAEGAKILTEPVGKAKIYLVTKPLAGAARPRSSRPLVGEAFERSYFNGSYKLHDDGRRSGTLTIKVENNGEITGVYYSDKDGRKYDVFGKVGTTKFTIQFTIKFPRTMQSFQGWMFTGDAAAITGTSRLLERETGFYAVRSDD